LLLRVVRRLLDLRLERAAVVAAAAGRRLVNDVLAHQVERDARVFFIVIVGIIIIVIIIIIIVVVVFLPAVIRAVVVVVPLLPFHAFERRHSATERQQKEIGRGRMSR
jgi:hypothetical protein